MIFFLVNHIVTVACKLYIYILIYIYTYLFRGGVYSQCQVGYIGPLCQTCDMSGDIKYSKKNLYSCVLCKGFDQSIPEIIFILIIIIGFYIYMIW